MPPSLRSSDGFTLIEVLVVSIVIALLAAIALNATVDSYRLTAQSRSGSDYTIVRRTSGDPRPNVHPREPQRLRARRDLVSA